MEQTVADAGRLRGGGGGEEARAEQGGQEGERRRAHAVVCESNKRVSAGTFVGKRKEASLPLIPRRIRPYTYTQIGPNSYVLLS